MGTVAKYEVKLVGKQAHLGDVAAVDVARLILDVQTVVARAAGIAIHRPLKATGRWEAAMEATKLRLVGVTRGSVLVELQPPTAGPVDGEFDIPVESLADLGWETATRMLNGVEDEGADADVLVRLLGLADHLSLGDRFDSVEFRTDGQPVARLDREKRETLRAVVKGRAETPSPPPAVAGVLFEADFERHTAKVRTQEGNVVELIFEEGQSETIKKALRERSQFQGEVTFDPVTGSVKAVRLRRITRFEQLLLGEEGTQAFWRPITYDVLADEQGTHQIDSFDDLRDTSLSEDEFQRFIDALS